MLEPWAKVSERLRRISLKFQTDAVPKVGRTIMKRMGVLFSCLVLCGLFAVCPTVAQAEEREGTQGGEVSKLVGDWTGESICVNKEKFPACHDEQVVYHLVLASGKTDTVTLSADKIVNGKPE